MGNVNCIPSRHGISDWIRSKFKQHKKITVVSKSDGDVDAIISIKTVERSGDLSTEPNSESSESVSEKEVDIRRGEEADLVDAVGHTRSTGCVDLERPVSLQHNYEDVVESKLLDENKNESIAPLLDKPYDNDKEISSDHNARGDIEDTHDLDDDLVDADRPLRHYGLCLFEDEISDDPVEASLLASGLEDVNPETREAIDIMVMFRTLPLVKAIDRIKDDERGLLRRKDPIPEGERSGSIRDLGWSRHVKNLEKEEADRRARRRRGSHDDSNKKTNHISQDNKRFSKCTDHMNEIDEGDALDQFLSKRRNRRPRDMVSNGSGPGEGSGIIQRQTSHWRLPRVE